MYDEDRVNILEPQFPDLDRYYARYFKDWKDLQEKVATGQNQDFQHLTFPE
ncbi:hypothetical protein [Candidatus Poriferisocius sp.]|uniref:hypothetical protein n=1 Tax=Candidatus Poriferisocius sp. TaxID=3101276 RepID=UPI003B01863B